MSDKEKKSGIEDLSEATNPTRGYRSREDRLRVIEEFRTSGKTRAEFCRDKGLVTTSLWRWLTEESKMRGESPKMGGGVQFREMGLMGSSAWMEVEVSGKVIRIFPGCPWEWVEKVLGREE